MIRVLCIVHKLIAMAYLFEDQAVPQGTPPSLNIPVYWETQSSCVQEFQVLSGTEEWKLYETPFVTSMPVYVKQITRIQNLWLWEAYQFNKARMVKKNDGIDNKLTLYNGSREISPMVVSRSEDGFDLHLSNKGRWGVALCFSESTKYADKFAHVTSEGDKELLIMHVLVEEAYDYGTTHNRDLRMPPVKDKSRQNLENKNYDSVSAITKDTRVYMSYERHKTYPAYVVK